MRESPSMIRVLERLITGFRVTEKTGSALVARAISNGFAKPNVAANHTTVYIL
jgi:hypothetical protein